MIDRPIYTDTNLQLIDKRIFRALSNIEHWLTQVRCGVCWPHHPPHYHPTPPLHHSQIQIFSNFCKSHCNTHRGRSRVGTGLMPTLALAYSHWLTQLTAVRIVDSNSKTSRPDRDDATYIAYTSGHTRVYSLVIAMADRSCTNQIMTLNNSDIRQWHWCWNEHLCQISFKSDVCYSAAKGLETTMREI